MKKFNADLKKVYVKVTCMKDLASTKTRNGLIETNLVRSGGKQIRKRKITTGKY